MLRVLHISTATSWRGGERQILFLFQALSKKGVLNYLMCPEASALSTKSFPAETTVIQYQRGSFPFFFLPRLMARICQDSDIHIVHAHDSHAHNILWLAYVLGMAKNPGIITRRVDFPIHRVSVPKYNHKRIKKIICISDAVKEKLAPNIRRADRLEVIHSAVDLSDTQKSKSNYFEKLYAFSENTILVANVAAIAPHKDYFTFVNTAEEFAKISSRNVKFLIIGEDAGEKKRLEQYIRSKNLDDKVVICGFINDIEKYLNEVDIMLVTSKEEGLNSSILDAFVAKLPVVATKAGGIVELIDHGQTGLLSEIGDAKSLAVQLEFLLKHPAKTKNIISNAYKFVQNFSSEKMASKYISTYERLL